MSSNEAIWAAGLFDGEGSTGQYKQAGGRSTLRWKASVTNTNKKLLDRFCCAVGFGKVGGPCKRKSEKHSPLYYWQTDSVEGLCKLHSVIGPYLSHDHKRDTLARAAEASK